MLFGIADEDVCVVKSRYAAFDKDKVERGVDTYDFEVLLCSSFAAHSSGHFLAGPDTAWVLYTAKSQVR